MENNILILADSSLESCVGIWKICQIAKYEMLNIYVYFRTNEDREKFFDLSPEYSVDDDILIGKSICYFLNEDEFYEEFSKDVYFHHLLEFAEIILKQEVQYNIWWKDNDGISGSDFEEIPLSQKSNANKIFKSLKSLKKFYYQYYKNTYHSKPKDIFC